jgi:hypothetical protein
VLCSGASFDQRLVEVLRCARSPRRKRIGIMRIFANMSQRLR